MGYHIPPLEVRKIAGGWKAYPPSVTTTDDLYLYSNYADATPYLKLNGAGNLVLATTGGDSVQFYDGLGLLTSLYKSGSDTLIHNLTDAENIFLKTTGTGLVKFGTHVASGDVVANGSISILDALGNTRKLMTTA